MTWDPVKFGWIALKLTKDPPDPSDQRLKKGLLRSPFADRIAGKETVRQNISWSGISQFKNSTVDTNILKSHTNRPQLTCVVG